ncbi:MAG TPA: hypothetical protein VMT85_09315 [Thermoanaerobaculia bacterium]|nr:hypothetical protein [Thermoanaerobaculia bacterium]
MSTLLAALAVLAVLAWCWTSGLALLRVAGARPAAFETRHALALVAGLLLGHALLLLADLARVPWTRGTLLAGGAATLAALAAASQVARPGAGGWGDGRRGEAARWDWADGVALMAVLVFAASSLALRSPFPDFVYHWGLKGHRFFLARGIDAEFLARPENGYLHPDYPNLLPDAFAAAALLAGSFDPRALMLFTPIVLLALLGAVRASLRTAALSPFARRAVFAGLACALGAFCIGYLQAGSADPLLALAVALAAGALLLPVGRPAAIQLGLAAAFGCAVKVEGLPFAALAIVAFVARALLRDRRALRAPTVWIALLAPPMLVSLPWWLRVRALDLFQNTNTGRLDLARLADVLAPLWRQTFVEEWMGLPLLLGSLPFLALARSTRWLGFLLGGQLAFYLFVYLSAPFDPVFYVLSTFPRLALHLLPATVVGLALALAGPAGAALPD